MSTLKLFILRHGQSDLNHENIFCGWIDAKLTDKGRSQAKNAGQLIAQHCKSNGITLPQIGFTSRLLRTEQTMDVILNELQLGKKDEVSGQFNNPVFVVFDYIYTLAEIRSYLLSEKEENPISNEIPVLRTWRLNERHYGAWQGQRKPKVLKEYGEEQYMYIRRDYNGRPPEVDLEKEMIQKHDLGAATGYEFKEPNRSLKYELEELNQNIKLPYSESLSDVVARLEPFLDEIILKVAKEFDLDSCLIVGHGSSVRSLLKILEGVSDEDIKGVDIPNGIPLVIELDKTNNFKFLRKYYLDPELAKINAEKVRKEGFEENP
ncbi:uncharacterized protein GVI51_K01551 [Nakaseomyces glabratus]|uniref:Phosphoglycerate mutase n=2 Tax=Candida glabrata TaxID=5478 RepID=Q6FN95_CANGA|nr:uncharacterized protein CAGL0K01705g [Nakaseomyces glabratus]KAH7582069.1 Phosphoglycerate mutase family phosphohistidine signature [Nakaseomyces glabratus]KAH7584400.1 Phosphoglycerate mutase family phosphohistidine signature [Nakaseomyces glabratus]KAH7596000.1 Phosphoglycerate mutase family phosphohistidine signature [Nakaseomyces glabratus]KAH7596857.1 Phosphoglycerate mutase family phosphohistidine signature [Nakaseomyces glabratus]KAH7602628.1 Phosphoglycerate mutase family phosphohis|eukprot:XP_448299.1 uncharacterized protein CAGL0K01705g [[Candida] glabrata]